jgi:Kinesin motor domain
MGNGAMQVIYDLLVPNSNELQLREDPVLGVVPAGLTRLEVTSARDILKLLDDGNSRRKTERTDANARSSRSHAVLEVHVKRGRLRTHYKVCALHVQYLHYGQCVLRNWNSASYESCSVSLAKLVWP